MPTKVEIVSKALVLLGQGPIGGLDSKTRNTQAMDALYPLSKRMLLASSYWKFALREVPLAALSDGGSQFRSNLNFAYQLPSDCVRPIGDPVTYSTFQIAGNELYSDSQQFVLLYVADVDEAWFTPWFSNALAYQLAYEASLAVSEDSVRRQLLERPTAQARAEAMGIDATTQSTWDIAISRIMLRNTTPRF